ncbi:MAG TPA: ABC transporter substrate-binding protein [Geobacteraceae bacterium]
MPIEKWRCAPVGRWLLLMLLLAAAGCTQRKEHAAVTTAGTKEQVTICQGGILTVLPVVAREKGLFAAEGLDVDLTTCGDGKFAMEAFLAGACTVATVGEPPVVRQSFERDDFRIVASTVSSDNATRILARRDRGITTPRDLKGKKIGVREGTISHFFLDVFLKKNGLTPGDVTVSFVELRKMPQALAAGEIDAYSSSDLYYLEGVQLLGDRAVTFSEPGLCYNAANLVVKRDFLASRPETVRRLLRALVAAEGYVAAHPAETRQLVAAVRQVAPQDLEAVFRNQRHVMALGPSLILSLENQARWLIEKGTVARTEIPNYLRFLAPGPLRTVKAAAVTLGQ